MHILCKDTFKSQNLLNREPIISCFFFVFLFLIGGKSFSYAQDTIVPTKKVVVQDSLSHEFSAKDTLVSNIVDSMAYTEIRDSLAVDSLNTDRGIVDSTNRRKYPNSENKIDTPVDYKARDSIIFDLKNKTAYLHQKGEILYENIELKSDYVVVNFDIQELYAEGVPDSLGEMEGEPIFVDGGKPYNSKTLRYNFKSKKGIISHIVTKEGEGYLHGDRVKKMNDSVMYLSSGSFTTCDLDHPHFAIEFSKSKLITGDRIITSTAYLSIGDVPTPLIIPFGVFPFSQTRTSGILIPSYGWEKNRGYYLQRGGYYFAINDYVDLALRGNIYTNLSWGINAVSNYYKRYKFRGNVDLTYENVKQGIEGTQSEQSFNNFQFRWKHEQDPKANPRSRFSADVNFVSQKYGQYSTNVSDYLNNTTSSSIAYQTKIGNSFNANVTLSETYNTQTKTYNITFPEFRLYSNQLEPFKRKKQTGEPKWYEKIYLSYTLNTANKISSLDSLLFKKETLKGMRNGMSHEIPVSYSTKVLKYFNWTSSINYTERWYLQSIEKQFDLSENKVAYDTLRGFKTNREASFSSNISTQVYGMFNFKNKYVKAFRHVITPTLGFTYRPDFGKPRYGFWKSYQDSELRQHFYSVFENSLYGGPPNGESGNLNFSLGNKFEMKTRNKKDTVNGTRKIMLIEDLRFSMGYDIAKDSCNFSPLSITGRTTLFKSLRIDYRGSFSPYCIDTNGVLLNQFIWEKDKNFFRKENTSWQLSLSYSLNPSTFKKDNSGSLAEESKPPAPPVLSPFNNPNEYLGTHVDFSVPWSLNISYSLNFTNRYIAKELGYESKTIQTLNFSGDFSLTPKWKIGFSSGYDFENKEMSYTSIDVYRDLHCWEMRFNWVPIGFRKSWNFTIAVKASMLKDAMKYEMKQDFRDNENFYH